MVSVGSPRVRPMGVHASYVRGAKRIRIGPPWGWNRTARGADLLRGRDLVGVPHQLVDHLGYLVIRVTAQAWSTAVQSMMRGG